MCKHIDERKLLLKLDLIETSTGRLFEGTCLLRFRCYRECG